LGEKFRQNVKKRKKEEEIFCHNNPAFSDEKARQISLNFVTLGLLILDW
jgi:hypothetical protein